MAELADEIVIGESEQFPDTEEGWESEEETVESNSRQRLKNVGGDNGE